MEPARVRLARTTSSNQLHRHRPLPQLELRPGGLSISSPTRPLTPCCPRRPVPGLRDRIPAHWRRGRGLQQRSFRRAGRHVPGDSSGGNVEASPRREEVLMNSLERLERPPLPEPRSWWCGILPSCRQRTWCGLTLGSPSW